MKAIKNIFTGLVLTALLIYSCDDDDFTGNNVYSGPSFVRFHLVLDRDSVPLDGGLNDYGRQTVDAYNHKLIKPAKIPVVLTTADKLSEEVTVHYSTVKTGEFAAYTQSPVNQLSFGPNKYIDTIIIDIDERWDTSKVNQLKFELLEVSDPSISIGSLNDAAPNDKLTFNFGKLITTCTMPTSRIEIEGIQGETFDFKVDFPNGLFVSELESIDLFERNDGFEYTLTQHPIKKGDLSIGYTFTLNENINNDDAFFESRIDLRDDLAYTAIGNTSLQIVKPIKVERDKSTDPASHFYNLSDPYYRTRGEIWWYDEVDNVSEWQSFSTFAHPVIVAAPNPSDPNDPKHEYAVLHAGEDTPDDPSDDVYHHAFKIKFASPNSGRTTNPFALKKLLGNYYADEDQSPGFNIAEALEYYPKDGNNPNEGTVMVVSQRLVISNKEGKVYEIDIKGSGAYSKVSDTLWEMELTVSFTNDELWGGTNKVHYHIFNSLGYQEPDLIDVQGATAVEL